MLGRTHACASPPHSHAVVAKSMHGLTTEMYGHASATIVHFNVFSAFFQGIPYFSFVTTFWGVFLGFEQRDLRGLN